MTRLRSIVLAAALAASTAGMARAGELYAGGFAHDITLGVSENGREAGQDINVGYRTEAVDGLRGIGRPMIYADYYGNTARRTSFGGAGFLWRRSWLRDRLYGQAGLGLVLHDQADHYPDPNTPGLDPAEVARREALRDSYKALGSRLLFQPSLSLGWRLTPRVAVEAAWVHISNAHILGNPNPGLDDVGARVVWRFGKR
jgi:hypothetical protein